MKKPELLAPAGDLARAKVAINYGADAVYLGGQSFSLRSRASNFSMEDIREVCDYARQHDANIHVTVNIIPHNEDFEGLEEYLIALEDAGVTAIITASVSIMELAKRIAPKLEVHCSTQMSVSNSFTAQLMVDENHVDRVVLARECSMDEVREITAKCPVETEAFIHGGMCANISGRCALSNRMTLRDANRGGCAHSCRWAYHLYDGETEISTFDSMFTMGSRDMMAGKQMRDLMEAGVASLKIEGRMKSEYYVASIVSGYRNLIDEIYDTDGEISDERLEYLVQKIMKGENREDCPGFYDQRPGAESIIYHSDSSRPINQDFVGTVLDYDEETKHAHVEVRNVIVIGDQVETLAPRRPNEEFTVTEMWDRDDLPTQRVFRPMEIITMTIPFTVYKDDLIRKV